NQIFRLGVQEAYAEVAPTIYSAYGELCRVCPLALRTPNRVFLSHSCPPDAFLDDFKLGVIESDTQSEADCMPGRSVYSLVWCRDTEGETVARFLARVDADLLISGHIPCDDGFDTPNDRQLILDASSHPSKCCLFPTDRPVTLGDLVAGLQDL